MPNLSFLPPSLAAQSRPQAQPLICKCQNGGVCVESEDMRCACDTDYSGTHCENEVRRVLTFGESSKAAVIVPVFLIVIVVLTSAGLYIYYRRNPATV